MKTCSCAGFWELKHLYLYVIYLQQFIQFSSGPMKFLLPWSCPFVILLLPYAPISVLLPYLFPLGSSSSPRYLLYKTREVCPMSSFLFLLLKQSGIFDLHIWESRSLCLHVFSVLSLCLWRPSWKVASLAFSVCHIQEDFTNFPSVSITERHLSVPLALKFYFNSINC